MVDCGVSDRRVAGTFGLIGTSRDWTPHLTREVLPYLCFIVAVILRRARTGDRIRTFTERLRNVHLACPFAPVDVSGVSQEESCSIWTGSCKVPIRASYERRDPGTDRADRSTLDDISLPGTIE
jgi:hypothetical protein